MSTRVQQLFDLSGKTALVTGGSRGLGLQIAEALGEAGAKIMLTSRKAADLEEAAADLKAKGIEALWIAADASDAAQVQKVVDDAMQRLSRIDILVNNRSKAFAITRRRATGCWSAPTSSGATSKSVRMTPWSASSPTPPRSPKSMASASKT